MSFPPIKCLIIDDDPFIQELLKDKLNQHIPQAEILAIASSGTEGLEKINYFKPELIFLDVEMGDMTGFEMLEQLTELSFQTIFITSYSHYAIKAIRFNALDYLVKPIDLGELKAAINRYYTTTATQQANHIKQALVNLKTQNVGDQTLTLQTQEGELRIQLKNIIRIEGDRNYSTIHLNDKRKKLVSKTLGDLEELLSDKCFFRSHKSHLINYFHIKSIPNSTSIILSDEEEFPIARRKKTEFKAWYDGFQE